MWGRSSSEVKDGEGATLRAAGGKFGRFRPHERGTGLIERSPGQQILISSQIGDSTVRSQTLVDPNFPGWVDVNPTMELTIFGCAEARVNPLSALKTYETAGLSGLGRF